MAKKIPQINASSMADISFLLLIFFLVTTSMDVNKGLARRLPAPVPPDQKVEDTKIKERDLFVVSINSANQLLVQQEQNVDTAYLREKAYAFILNSENDPNLPVLYTDKDFGEPIGVIPYTRDHVISVQTNVDTRYQTYLDVQNVLVSVYNGIRNDCAKKYFGKPYAELTEEQQEQIQDIYPMKISEAEPKNYGAK